ncbi:UDP-glucose 4-epimerase [Zancudomyces culisetae]|uniref:UDP-glucose 4-epimerase n=1 Tax=Zancudomyces culisetae TaxID=1213189 RepID=A0A1R1PY72_ZANCU|nr:UDP-glucose 4-epimerase [Zancudomyces culisetae]|eukprot:OMH85914.1 UDP-glucose 4-epimerase [Zancudomyces culisetae]
MYGVVFWLTLVTYFFGCRELSKGLDKQIKSKRPIASIARGSAFDTRKEYILVTGGTGYIGSHTVLKLIEEGYDVVVLDNLSNSVVEPLRRIERILGLKNQIPFYEADLLNYDDINAVFKKYRVSCVIHFAALKAVEESTREPLRYYDNNFGGTVNLLKAMQENSVKNIVFSSSATVYEYSGKDSYTEDSKLACTNPYGRTKLFMESVIEDIYNTAAGTDKQMNAVILRYFNPFGAHPSGLMGEDAGQLPNNLMPYIAQVAVGELDKVHVFGADYNTKDGTGVRDFIHIMDLARAHVYSVKKTSENCGLKVYNVGSGSGYSVLEMIEAMKEACNCQIPFVIDGRRSGDVDKVVCDPTKAERELGFKVEYTLKDMCRDLWRWQQANPHGYRTKAEKSN